MPDENKKFEKKLVKKYGVLFGLGGTYPASSECPWSLLRVRAEGFVLADARI
jgi:hypothetical protein